MLVPLFYIVQMLTAGVMLLHASVLDIRFRRVGDKVFTGYAAAGLLGVVWSYLNGGYSFTFTMMLLAVAVTVPLAWAPYYLGWYAGADAKALIALSLILPTYHPVHSQLHPFTSIMTLSNSLLFALPVAVSLLVLKRRDVKLPFLPLLLLGYLTVIFFGDLLSFIPVY